MESDGDGGAGIDVTGNGADIVNITISGDASVKGGKSGGANGAVARASGAAASISLLKDLSSGRVGK